MPLFLIPIAAGAYMYYEKRKKEMEDQESGTESGDETSKKAVSSQQSASDVSDDCAEEEVIELQLSRESSLVDTCISRQVEVVYDDMVVPDGRESQVSTDDDDEEEGIELHHTTTSSRPETTTEDIDMKEFKKSRLRGSLGSFKTFLQEQADGLSRKEQRNAVRVVAGQDGSSIVTKGDKPVALPKISFK